jgi:cytochrome c556
MARTTKIIEIAIAAALFAGCAGAVLAQDAATAISTRKAAMKANGAAVGVLRGAATATDPAALTAAGKSVHANLTTFAANLPKGSGPESGVATRAKPEIWTDAAGFKAALDSALAAADTLAKAPDLASAQAAAGAVGRTCGGCHTKYQAPATPAA